MHQPRSQCSIQPELNKCRRGICRAWATRPFRPTRYCATLALMVGSGFLRKSTVTLLLLPLLAFAFSGSLEIAHPIEEFWPADSHTHTASDVDRGSICAEEDHHGNHNCLHAQQFTPALNPILVFGKSPVFRTPPFVTENVRLFKVGIPPLRGPPLS